MQVNKSRLIHVEHCQNLVFIFGINKALESDAGFPGIPASLNDFSAIERWDPPRSGESQSAAVVWSLALQLSASKSLIYVIFAGISCEVESYFARKWTLTLLLQLI